MKKVIVIKSYPLNGKEIISRWIVKDEEVEEKAKNLPSLYIGLKPAEVISIEDWERGFPSFFVRRSKEEIMRLWLLRRVETIPDFWLNSERHACEEIALNEEYRIIRVTMLMDKGENMSINEYLAKYSKTKNVLGYTYKMLCPEVECADGWTVSVQASEKHHCTPKSNDGPYKTVEVGYPLSPEELLTPYEDGKYGIYNRVPVEIVDEVIKKHGGFAL